MKTLSDSMNDAVEIVDEVVCLYNENLNSVKETVPEFAIEIECLISEFIFKYVFLGSKLQKHDYLRMKALKLLLKLFTDKKKIYRKIIKIGI